MLKTVQKIFYYSVRLLCIVFCKTCFRVKFYGKDNIPKKQGCIFASNHASFFDPVFVGSGVPYMITYLARSSLFRTKLFGTLIKACNSIPIRRNIFDREAVQEVLRRLKASEGVLLFPEGTRSKDGLIGEAKAGIGKIALQADVPVIPVYIDGASEVWPKGSKRIRFVPVKVFYGKPIILKQELADKQDLSEKEKIRFVADLVVSKIREIQSRQES